MVTTIPFLRARITDDSDFLKLKELANIHEFWNLDYDKNGLKIWSRSVPETTIKMMKVWIIFPTLRSLDLYHTLMDPIYRKEWDNHMVLSYDIGYLNPNNGVTYYAASCPPLRSRDFVLQTSWLDRESEHYVMNHSICHKDHPPRSGYVRAISYFTGYYVKKLGDEGCEMSFVSQTDPQGFIPSWIVNKCTQILAPRFVKRLEKAALYYSTWKNENNPNYLPWVHPEQMKSPKISVTDCVPCDEERQSSFFRYLLEKASKMDSSLLVAPKDTVQVLYSNTVTPGPSKIVNAAITEPISEQKSVINENSQASSMIGKKEKKIKKKQAQKEKKNLLKEGSKFPREYS